jgi:hypothetical protein
MSCGSYLGGPQGFAARVPSKQAKDFLLPADFKGRRVGSNRKSLDWLVQLFWSRRVGRLLRAPSTLGDVGREPPLQEHPQSLR